MSFHVLLVARCPFVDFGDAVNSSTFQCKELLQDKFFFYWKVSNNFGKNKLLVVTIIIMIKNGEKAMNVVTNLLTLMCFDINLFFENM